MPKFETTEARNQEIVTKFMQGDSYSELSFCYGLSYDTIRQVVKKANVNMDERQNARKGRRALSTRDPISRTHWRIGNDIVFYRTTVKGQAVRDFARDVSISASRLVEIESGVADPSLAELIRIAQHLSLTIEGLATGKRGEPAQLAS